MTLIGFRKVIFGISQSKDYPSKIIRLSMNSLDVEYSSFAFESSTCPVFEFYIANLG
jgi:hypothetical protein